MTIKRIPNREQTTIEKPTIFFAADIEIQPFGEFLVLVFYGLFAVSGTYWLQTHSFNWLTLVPGLSLGLIGAAILFVNNYRDLDHDRSVGRYTLVAACGRKLANTLYMLMIFLPFVFKR